MLNVFNKWEGLLEVWERGFAALTNTGTSDATRPVNILADEMDGLPTWALSTAILAGGAHVALEQLRPGCLPQDQLPKGWQALRYPGAAGQPWADWACAPRNSAAAATAAAPRTAAPQRSSSRMDPPARPTTRPAAGARRRALPPPAVPPAAPAAAEAPLLPPQRLLTSPRPNHTAAASTSRSVSAPPARPQAALPDYQLPVTRSVAKRIAAEARPLTRSFAKQLDPNVKVNLGASLSSIAKVRPLAPLPLPCRSPAHARPARPCDPAAPADSVRRCRWPRSRTSPGP
jgi:hypothetical protein